MRALFVSKNLAFSLVLTPEWAEHTVQMCGSIAEAQAELAVAKFDVIVSDTRLPDGTAAQLAMHVRGSGLETPLVVVGGGEEHERLAVLAAGADDYVARTSTLSRSLPAAIRAANDRRRLDAANAETEFDVLYVGADVDFVRHLEASPGVRVSHVADSAGIPDPLTCQLATVDAQGFEAAGPVWRIRAIAPDVPVVLVGDAATLATGGQMMPFGVDDVIVRSYEEDAQIVPRLRSLAASRLVPAMAVAAGGGMSGGGVMTREPEEPVMLVPAPRPTPEPLERQPPVEPQAPVERPTEVAAPATAPAPATTNGQGGWLEHLVTQSRAASLTDVATAVIGEIDRVLTSVGQAADLQDAAVRAHIAAAAFLKFARWRSTPVPRCVVDVHLDAMTPLLTELLDGWGELTVERAAPDCSVIATAGELRRAVTALVVACRDSLTAGGTVHIRSDVGSGRLAIDVPWPSADAVPVVRVRVVRIGLDARPVVISPSLRTLAEEWAGECTPIDSAGGCVGAVLSLPILAPLVKA